MNEKLIRSREEAKGTMGRKTGMVLRGWFYNHPGARKPTGSCWRALAGLLFNPGIHETVTCTKRIKERDIPKAQQKISQTEPFN